MKLICGKEELSRGLSTSLRTVGARAGIPALSGVLMELTDTDLCLTTTDLELTTRVRLPVTGEAGKVVVPAKYLAEIVRSFPADDVELVTEDGAVKVTGGRARFVLRSLPAEDFPRVQAAEDFKTFTVDGDLLAEALNQVAAAASRDETRPVLTGVLFEGSDEELRVVATDSYRLAVRTLPVTSAAGVKMLVPARAVMEVARLAGTDEVGIEVSSSQVSFNLGTVVVQSRLIEGEFPSYRQLIPEDQPFTLTIDQGLFLEALKRVAVLAQDATPVYCELEPDRVRITCQAQGVGDAAEEVDATYVGDPLRIAFNAHYLDAGISAVKAEQVRVTLSDAQRPVLIRSAGADSGEFVYLLMPIRVG